MKRISKIHRKSKRVLNKTPKLNIYFASILKLCLALALFIMAAISISGAGITAENGALNVSNNLFIDTNTLFVDSTNNRVGIGTTSPGRLLEVAGSINGTQLNISGPVNLAYGSGNVGIGTASPQTKLDVRGIIGGGGSKGIFVDSSGNTGLGTSSPNLGSFASPVLTIFSPTQANFEFVSNDIDQAQIDVGQFSFMANSQSAGNKVVAQMYVITEGSTANNRGGVYRFATKPDGGELVERMRINSAGNVGIGTTAPNQKLMVSGNINVTGTVHYGALQANSPVLERTAEPFVAKCTIADDGKLVVEYIHFDAGAYSRVIDAVNSDSASWWHRSCFEKNEKFKFLDSLNNNSITIDDLGFDWTTKTAFLKT